MFSTCIYNKWCLPLFEEVFKGVFSSEHCTGAWNSSALTYSIHPIEALMARPYIQIVEEV